MDYVDLIRAGMSGGQDIVNCLELPLHDRSLVDLPFVQANRCVVAAVISWS